jgi:hypothetical protein
LKGKNGKTIIPSVLEKRGLLTPTMMDRITFKSFLKSIPNENINIEEWPKKNFYQYDRVHGCIAMKAPCGSGKTTELIKHIQESIGDYKYIFITNRIAQIVHLQTLLTDSQITVSCIYGDMNTFHEDSHVFIFQYESLFKEDMSFLFQLYDVCLIIDEAESLINEIHAGLSKYNTTENSLRLVRSLSDCTYMILMDESLMRYTTDFLRYGKKVKYYICTGSRMLYDTVQYEGRGTLEYEVRDDLESGIAIAICTDRKCYIKALQNVCIEEYKLNKNEVVVAYGGNNLPQDINWKEVKVFLYNSAIQHTVSIEYSNIQKVYAFFHDNKLDLMEKWNMMQRVRTLKELKIWQKPIKNRIPISNLEWLKKGYIDTIKKYTPKYIGGFTRDMNDTSNNIAMNFGGTVNAIKVMKSSIPATKEGYEMVKGIKFKSVIEDDGSDILYKTKKDPLKVPIIPLSKTISGIGGNLIAVHKDMRLQKISDALSQMGILFTTISGTITKLSVKQYDNIRVILKDDPIMKNILKDDVKWRSNLNRIINSTRDYKVNMLREGISRNTKLIGVEIERL